MNAETFNEWMKQVPRLTLRQRELLRKRLDALDGQHQALAVIELPGSTEPRSCPHCQGTDLDRHGQVSGLQRYRCQICHRTFNSLTGTALARLDWGLLLVFVLMFIDLRLLAGLGGVRRLMAGLDLAQPLHLYFTGIAASQIISNVPAAIALAEYSKDWRLLAYGVNVGGFGLVLGSLANLIALRMAQDRRAWLSFHLYSLPFLLVAAAVGYGLIVFASPG